MKVLSIILYFIGILTMFLPAISGQNELTSLLIPGGFVICTLAIIVDTPNKKTKDPNVLDEEFDDEDDESIFLTDEQEVEMLQSKGFNDFVKRRIQEETWGKGLPMIYMNDKKQVVKHWKDGKIEIIEDLKNGTGKS